ncbi:MFS transporter [Actinacidiphila sp. bgisy144]|uniref:MFS transporter n=1 Tax=Actinacidiphila sp. bgisy144 TaxID=3413791 RepID=UPI003EBD2FFC
MPVDSPSPGTPATTPRAAPSAAAGTNGAFGHEPPGLSALGLFTVLLGAALPLIDFFIVNVALSTIDKDLGAGPALLELVVAGYGLAYAVLLVLGGRLGDTFGRRRLFIAGLAGFGITSLACGLAPDPWALVVARVAQGAAAAMMMPQVLGTIHASTTGDRRARAVGLYGATQGLSMVAGQILGGVLVTADLWGSGWRAIFLVNVPIAVVGLLMSLRTVPDTRSPRPEPVDVPGTLLLAAALAALLLPLTEGRATGWPVWTWVLLALSPLLALAFQRVEVRADRLGRTPLVPPSLLRLDSLRRGLALLPPFGIGFGGLMFVLAIALQQGLRMTAVVAGLALVPFALAVFAASLTGPRLVARHGAGRMVTFASVLQFAGGVLLMFTFWHSWPHLQAWGLAPAFLVIGFAQGVQLPVLFRIVLSDVPHERAGVGSGVMTTTQQAALALGVATIGSLFLALLGPWNMRDALLVTLLAWLAATAATALLSLRLPRTIA